MSTAEQIEEPMSTSDLIATTLNEKPLDFQHVFNDLIQSKIDELVDGYKLALAENLITEEIELTEDADTFLQMCEDEEVSDEELDEAWGQLDELSRKTLASYVDKAATSAAVRGHTWGKKESDHDEIMRMTNRHGKMGSFDFRDKVMKAGDATSRDVEQARNKTSTRLHWIGKAAKKLAKEEVVTEEDSTPDEDRASQKSKRAQDRLRKLKDKRRYNEEIEIEKYLDYLGQLDEESVDEELEQLDELSNKTLKSYIKKAEAERGTRRKPTKMYVDGLIAHKIGGNEAYLKTKFHKRSAGITKAKNRLFSRSGKSKRRYGDEDKLSDGTVVYKHKVPNAYHKEETQLDELSKSTLVSYLNKSHKDSAESEKQRENIRHEKNRTHSDVRGPWVDADHVKRSALNKLDDIHYRRQWKREEGRFHATNRLQGKFSSVGDRKEVTKMKTRINNRGREVTEPKKEIEFTPKKYKGD